MGDKGSQTDPDVYICLSYQLFDASTIVAIDIETSSINVKDTLSENDREYFIASAS